MSRRRLPLMLAVVGAVIILAAIIAASVVRSSDTATLALPERPEVPVVISEPGVLDAVAPDVTIRATADDGEPVVLAVGRTAEVEAWLGEADHARVTGLSSWEELTVEVVVAGPQEPATDDATPTAAPTPEATAADDATPADDATAAADATPAAGAVPDPAGSDLWLAETVATGSAELTWTDAPGQWSLVAATDGSGPAPLVELEWGRQASTPWLVPLIVLGVAVLLAGIVMIVLDVLAAREQRRRDDEVRRRSVWEPRGTGPVASVPVSVHDTDPGTGERFSRRQLREMERAMARADRDHTEAPAIPLAPGTGDDGTRDDDAPTPEQDPPARGDDPDEATPAGTAGDETTGPGSAEDDIRRDDAPQDDARQDDGPEDDDTAATDAAPPPSWRSVWGFGAPRTEPDADRPDTTQGEER